MTNITVLNCNGLFESFAEADQYITESGKNISLSVNAKDTKDPLFITIDMSGVSATDAKLCFGDSKEIALTGGKVNIIPVTTAGSKDEKGDISFKISSETVTFDSSMKIAVRIISYTPVINH